MGLGQFWGWPWCRALYLWSLYKALPLWPGIGLRRLHSISFPFLVVDIVGDCVSLSLSFWVWAYNWLAAFGHQSELRKYPLSPSVPLLATERSVSSLWSTPNTFIMFWIQLHKLWAGKETVLAHRVLQQHTVLLHKVPPICPGRFPILSVLWSSFKLTKS